MELLDRLTEIAYEMASKKLITTKDELLSMFLLYKGTGQVDVIGCPWHNDQDKQDAVREVGLHMIRSNDPIQAYSLLSECWTSNYTLGEALRADRPEHDPKRQECVICLASDGQEHRFHTWKIGRDRHGFCVSLSGGANQGQQQKSWMIEALDKAMEMRDHMEAMKKEIMDGTGS